jgi:hypothetical protein
MTTFSASSLRLARFVIPGVCLATALGTSAFGQAFNVANGDWNTAGSWDPATVPTTGTAVFDEATPQTATISASTSIARINISSAAKTFQGLSGVQTLTLTSAQSSSLSTTLNLDSLTLSKTGSAGLSMSSGGAINLSNGGQYIQSNGQISISGVGTVASISGSGVASFSRAANPAGAVLSYGGNNQTFSIDAGVTATFSERHGLHDPFRWYGVRSVCGCLDHHRDRADSSTTWVTPVRR